MAFARPHGRARAGVYPRGLRDELGGASRAERRRLREGVGGLFDGRERGGAPRGGFELGYGGVALGAAVVGRGAGGRGGLPELHVLGVGEPDRLPGSDAGFRGQRGGDVGHGPCAVGGDDQGPVAEDWPFAEGDSPGVAVRDAGTDRGDTGGGGPLRDTGFGGLRGGFGLCLQGAEVRYVR